MCHGVSHGIAPSRRSEDAQCRRKRTRTHARTHAHARTHTHTHTRAHARAHTQVGFCVFFAGLVLSWTSSSRSFSHSDAADRARLEPAGDSDTCKAPPAVAGGAESPGRRGRSRNQSLSRGLRVGRRGSLLDMLVRACVRACVLCVSVCVCMPPRWRQGVGERLGEEGGGGVGGIR